MTNEQLIEISASVTEFVKLGDNSAGDVGCALLAENGKAYTGVCVDVMSSMGTARSTMLSAA